MSGATLTLDGVAKRWPNGDTALADVSLAIPAGTTLAVLGSSGAGKSTLLRLIAGLEQPDAGTIRLGEREIVGPAGRLSPEQRGVGMVFQALELWPHLTVAEHIAFGLPGRPRGRKARSHPDVIRLAKDVGLDESLLARRPDTLSGGEQQRVAIARTLAPKPGVILYDEPLANLDPERRAIIRALIRRLAREHGTTLVYVTHDPQEALELGDAVAVFADGRLVEHGTPTDVYARPSSILAARALGPVTAVPGEVTSGTATTALGSFPTDLADGPCMALWRPEALAVDPEGTHRIQVEDVVARGRDYAVHATCDGTTVQAVSAEPVAAGIDTSLRVGSPAAVLAADAVKETR